MTPFFSVIITTYNRPDKLIRAIDSVLSQEFQDFELIIVNDGSTADYDIVNKHIKDKEKIHYFYKQNEERSVARNFGVNKSNGTFICFLDDDDYYFNNHLSVIRKAIEENNFTHGIYHTYSIIKNADGTEKNMPIIPKNKKITEQEYYLTDGIMTVNSSCFSKALMQKYPYDPNLKMSEDSNQRLRAMKDYPVFRISEYTNIYDQSVSSTKVSDINIYHEFIKTWKVTFADESIKQSVEKKTRNNTFFLCYNLIVNYHRKEIRYSELIKYYFKLLWLNPTKALTIIPKNFYYKLTNK